MNQQLLIYVTILLAFSSVNSSHNYTDAENYVNCFQQYSNGILCPNTLQKCNQDVQCSLGMDWIASVCLPKCKQTTYTSSNSNITVRDVSCTKKCDSSVKSDNITNSTSKDIFDDQVTCYDYCYKYLAASKLQITLLMIILAAISIFVI